MTDEAFVLELRRHLLALRHTDDEQVRRRAFLGAMASVDKRFKQPEMLYANESKAERHPTNITTIKTAA